MSNRMVVLPEEVYKSMINRGSILQDPVDLSALGTHENMTRLLHAQGIPPGEQFTEYDQQLKRLLMLLRHKKETGRDMSLIEKAIISALANARPPTAELGLAGGDDSGGGNDDAPSSPSAEVFSPTLFDEGIAPPVPGHRPHPPPPRSASLNRGTHVLVKTGPAATPNGEAHAEDLTMESDARRTRTRRPYIQDSADMDTGAYRPLKRSASWDDMAHRVKGRTMEITNVHRVPPLHRARPATMRPGQRILKEKMERTRLLPLKLENDVYHGRQRLTTKRSLSDDNDDDEVDAPYSKRAMLAVKEDTALLDDVARLSKKKTAIMRPRERILREKMERTRVPTLPSFERNSSGATPRIVSKRTTQHDDLDEPHAKRALIDIKQEPVWRPSQPLVRPGQRIARNRKSDASSLLTRYIKEEPRSPPPTKQTPATALQRTIKKEVKQEGGRLRTQIAPFKPTLW